MHSLRAVFSAAGDETPPFSLRDLAKRLKVRPPITLLRTAAKLTFPENDVELFKSYLVSTEFSISDLANAVLPSKKISLPDIDGNKEARRLQENRFALGEVLMTLAGDVENPPLADLVREGTDRIRDLILRRDARTAESLIDDLPAATVRRFGPKNPIWGNALRRDDVKGFIFGGSGGLQQVILRGYKGPDVSESDRQRIVDIALLLRPNSAERRFRQNLLRAESLVGQRRFDEATKQYDKMLSGGGLSKPERKFIALRKAAAQNALADQAFNALPPGDSKQREDVRQKYLTTASILEANDVNIENPQARELLAHMENHLFLIDNGFNALGSPTVVRPPLGKSAAILKNEAKQRIDQAGAALDAFGEFTRNLEILSDGEVKIKVEISSASAAIDQLKLERDILREQKQKLEEQRQFLGLMLAAEIVASAAAIIAVVVAPPVAPALKAAAVAGGVSSGANGVARFAQLAQQARLLEIEQDILDLQLEGLDMRGREAQRHKSFLDALAESNTTQLQKYLELSNRFEDFTLEAIRGAIRKAYEAEVRLAFERGTAKLLGIVDPKILNYQNDEQLFVLHRTFIEDQLTKLSEEIDQPIQRTDLDRSIFLSKHDPLALARFQQTGETDFAISLYDVDQLFPGHPNIRITDVRLILPNEALPSDGVTVNLTHRGIFMVRDAETLMEARDLIPDAATLQQAHLAFSEGRTLTVGGVTIINAGENRRPFSVPSGPVQPSGNRQGLEGYGITGLWNLKINENELDEVKFSNLTEAQLKFFLVVEEAPTKFEVHVNELIRAYEKKQEEEHGDALDKITFFGMRDEFLDQLNELIDLNPEAGVELDIAEVMNKDDPETLLKAIVLQVVNTAGQGIPGIGLTAVNQGAPLEFILETQAGGFTEDLSIEIPIIPRGERFPVGTKWTLKVPNVQDLDIHDIRWFIVHEARKPESVPA